jgi:hypothetical protein
MSPCSSWLLGSGYSELLAQFQGREQPMPQGHQVGEQALRLVFPSAH